MADRTIGVLVRSPFTGEPFEVPPEFPSATLGALLKRGFELIDDSKPDKPKKRKAESTR